ncbi:MAG: hypothetical protein LBJ00_03900 [Planctomycetaceae bacterium]|jgi:hypothetical protein|nr:hypothetical protein [Planctomycetaceae bacterium]
MRTIVCSSCFEIPEAGHASVASRSGCSGAKPIAYTGIGITLIIVFFVPLFFSGCDCRHGGDGVFVSPTVGVSGDPARQAEDFLREIEVLNSLEGSPCLPDTQGAEKIIQTGDRLNNWIKRKRLDETWESEPEFIEVEKLIRRGVTNLESLVKLLYILQGKNPTDEQDDKNNQTNISSTLVAECKETVRCLAEVESVLAELGKRVGTSDLSELLTMISGMRERFSAIESIANINANAIRAFAKRFEQETDQIAGVAAYFNNFATGIKTDELFIQTSDVYYLIQSIWLRDISNWARGNKQDVLERVKNLFDWTICNISVRNQTTAANGLLPLQLPWQSALIGNASDLDRAWFFIELLRQQRIDAAILAVEDALKSGELFVWGVGVLVDDEVYVFVPECGTPLPAKDGLEFAEDGTLICKSIATFSQVLEDDSLLRKLDISETKKFPVTSEMLKKSTVCFVASPETVSMRMKVLEADLTGESNMILYTNIKEQRKSFANAKSMSNIKTIIWNHPFHAKFDQLFKYQLIGSYLDIFRTTNPLSKKHNFPLWSGRVQYFKGSITGQGGAMTYYQDARISDREVMELRADPAFRKEKNLHQILQLTTNQAVFWIGVASFERDSLENAKDSMKGLLLGTVNIWAISESYILGRIAEREKNYAEALSYYEKIAKGTTPQPAFELRAKWIREKTK